MNRIMSFFKDKIGSSDSYRTAIDELRRRVQLNEAEARTQLRKLGDYLSYLDKDRLEGTEMASLHRHILELREELPASRQQVRRIVQCIERNSELEDKLRGLQEERRGVERRSDELSEETARAALRVWRTELPDRPGLEEALGPLLRQEEEIRNLEEQLERLQTSAAAGGILASLRGLGSSLTIKGALASRRNAFGQTGRTAGRLLREMNPEGFSDGGEALKRILEAGRENDRRLRELREEEEKLRSDQAGLWQELKGLGADRSHQRRVRQLEQDIARIEGELIEASERLGLLYRAAPPGKRPDDEEASRYLERIATLEENSCRHRKQIERLEAALRLEELDRKSRRMEERVDRLEKEIRARQEEIKLLRARLSGTEAEREHLGRVRGEQATLLLQAPEEGREE